MGRIATVADSQQLPAQCLVGDIAAKLAQLTGDILDVFGTKENGQ
jgi:hypothetical protein